MQWRSNRIHPLAWWMLALVVWCTPARSAEFVYTVQPGDHLWSIAQRYLQSPTLAVPLRQLNQIPDDRRLMPGTRLRIPERWLRLQTTGVRVLAFSGEVSVLADGGASRRPPVVGESLQPPLVLRTGAAGSASLQFADGSRVLVLQDSELALRQATTRLLDRTDTVLLELVRGGMENAVQPRGVQGGRFEIRTPAAVAAVRGTHFRVHAWQEGDVARARSEVLEGAVQFGNAAGAVLAQAAQGSLASRGQPPAVPVALLPAPDLSALPALAERLPVDLPFAPLEGAAGYRSQIAPDAGFEVTLSDQTHQRPRVQAVALPDGQYVLRVRGIDANGLEGRSAQRVLQVHTQPVPPLQIEPAPGSITTRAQPSFRWTVHARARTYRLQISAAGTLQPLVDRQVDASGLAMPGQDLPPGAYQWRMAAFDADGRQGPFSDAQSFRIVEPGPQAEPTVGPQGDLSLRWSALPGVAGYRVQLADATGFEPPLRQAQTRQPDWPLPGLAPGSYQVRVQGLEPDGTALPWGDAQSFSVPEPETPAVWLRWLLLVPLLLL